MPMSAVLPFRRMARRATAIALMAALLPAFAQLPKRNLMVELRQIEEPASPSQKGPAAPAVTSSSGTGSPAAGGIILRTQRPEETAPELQQVQVLNGERASLRFAKAMPLQWVQAAAAQAASRSASAASSSSVGGSVVNAVTWLEAGHGLSVKPRWPGGKQPVTLEVQVDAATVDERTGAALPAQSRSQAGTTVLAPLGQWVTIATTGAGAPREQRGVYSSEAAGGDLRQLVQVRVLAP